MGLTLADSAGHTLELNAWSWGTLHQLVSREGVFAEEFWAPLRSGVGAALNPQGVQALVAFLETELLYKVRSGERIFINGTVSAEPDDGTFHRSESEQWRNYSLPHAVLVSVVDFLNSSRGAVTVR